MNSFKELQNNQIKLFAEARQKRVYERVHHSLGSLRFLSTIVEMYVPVMADTVVSLVGGPITAGDVNPDASGVNTDSKELKDDKIGPPSGPFFLEEDKGDSPRNH